MKFLKKIFNSKTKSDDLISQKVLNKNSISNQIPTDELFAIKFIENGGKFIYCANEIEAEYSFRDILVELGIYTKVKTTNDFLKDFFENYNTSFAKEGEEANTFLTNCEFLISDIGSVMFSSHQLREQKMEMLPETFIIFAKTSQIVKDINDAMAGIRLKYQKEIPSGLVTLRNFEFRGTNDAMSYGGNYKQSYLILLEDLL